MRYDKLGNALLHKLGKNASFAEVYLTAVELGIGIESKGPGEVVLTRKTGEDQVGWEDWLGWPERETRRVAPEEVADWMNMRMIEEGIIKEEPEP
jgi:hypothetical protein